MAFFKFRARGQKGDEPPASPAESIDDMRRRARHRLIGATVLVAIGVLGFPLVFDSQPRQVQVDIPIQIPDRDKTRLPGPASGRVAQAEPDPAPAPSGPVQANASLDAKEEVVTGSASAAPAAAPAPAPAKPAAAPTPAPAPAKAPEAKAEPRSDAKTPPKPAAATSVDDGARAKALLEGRTNVAAATAAPAAPAQAGRFVVQVGAFADANKARETRTRLERAGLKTYTQEVQTPDGRRIRVRIGPFSDRAEADKAAERVKSLSLSASVLTL